MSRDRSVWNEIELRLAHIMAQNHAYMLQKRVASLKKSNAGLRGANRQLKDRLKGTS